MNRKNCLNSVIGYLMLSFGFFIINSSAYANTTNEKPVYAQLASSKTQTSTTPAFVNMEDINEIADLKIENHNKIIVRQAGIYFIMATGQIGTVNFAPPGTLDLWLVHNNRSIPNTNVTKYISQRLETASVTSHAILALKKGDSISVGYSANTPFIGLTASPASQDESAVPSINFSMFKIN